MRPNACRTTEFLERYWRTSPPRCVLFAISLPVCRRIFLTLRYSATASRGSRPLRRRSVLTVCPARMRQYSRTGRTFRRSRLGYLAHFTVGGAKGQRFHAAHELLELTVVVDPLLAALRLGLR